MESYPPGEWSRIGLSAADDVAKSFGHSVCQAADQVFVVERDAAGGDQPEHPVPPHVDPTGGLKLIAHDMRGFPLIFGDQLGPIAAANLVERRAQHRIIGVHANQSVRLASLVL